MTKTVSIPYSESKATTSSKNKGIESVGPNTPTIVNKLGGKQSDSAYAMHLIDPLFLFHFLGIKSFPYEASFSKTKKNKQIVGVYKAMKNIAGYMGYPDNDYLLVEAVDNLILTKQPIDRLLVIAKVLKEGSEKYEPNNWRLIPEEEHLNHALIHLSAYLKGNKEDDHIAHAACRIMMAYATERSENFDYHVYIPNGDNVRSPD